MSYIKRLCKLRDKSTHRLNMSNKLGGLDGIVNFNKSGMKSNLANT